MNEDRIDGALKKMGGSIKETTGKVLGDSKLEAEGAAEKVEGRVQNAVGGVKDAITKND